MTSTERSLDALNARLTRCTRCPRLVAHRRKVAHVRRRAFQDQVYWGRPVPSSGDPRAHILLVGLAPGAHGSNRTGRMFTGDGSGDFLTPALYRAGLASQPTSTRKGDGLELRDVYIVAVAHCVPPANKPTASELANCRPYLMEHLNVLTQVRVLIPFGRVAHDGLIRALESMGHDLPEPRPAFAHGAREVVGPYTVLSTYHPSRQNTQTGRLTPRMFDAVFRRALGILGA